MNLEDLVDESGLQQDEWSLTAPTFGKDGQLKVIGHDSGKGNRKFYILKCIVCSQDPELFGGGYFRCTKSNLLQGRTPCGCTTQSLRSKEQFDVICTRKAIQLGYTFLSFSDDWKASTTKVRMLCNKHGEWCSSTINGITSAENGCPGCRVDTIVSYHTKPDEIMIASFFGSGGFHPDTKFWRSERKTKCGAKAYWYMSCPDCTEVGESFRGSLQKGQRSCACSIQRQKECYINWVVDTDIASPLAIKFGVARDSRQRHKTQNSNAVYEIHQHLIYKFDTVESCKKAERECKRELECGIVLKRDMKDGYTETTHVYNLDKIKQIYKKHGGVEVCHLP